MSKSSGTKGLLAAAAIGLFVAHSAIAQQTKRQGLPLGSTAEFVYFSTGSHELTADERGHLRDVAEMMQKTPNLVATIVGKTDTVGSPSFNERLSKRRADAVFESLVYDEKVPANRLHVCWTGERLPFIATANQVAESDNRMVGIIVGDKTFRYLCGD